MLVTHIKFVEGVVRCTCIYRYKTNRHRGHDCMVVLHKYFNVYYHINREYDSHQLKGVLDSTLCDKVFQR